MSQQRGGNPQQALLHVTMVMTMVTRARPPARDQASRLRGA
jgi:hypothetical protein